MGPSSLLSRLAQTGNTRIVLVVLDGLGDLRGPDQPQTPMELARLPHLDELAVRSSLGRLIPVTPGVTPGSGPAHLALFGYDPTEEEADIGRGVLEALGLGLEVGPDTVAVRGNFATADGAGNLVDRRAGRPSNDECRRLCQKLNDALSSWPHRASDGLEVEVHPAQGHRFVLLLEGPELSPRIADTDPQRLGVPPLELQALAPEARTTVEGLAPRFSVMQQAIAGEAKANRMLLRGFSRMPRLASLEELYGLRCAAFAAYPLYRGVAATVGMERIECGKTLAEMIPVVAAQWGRFDFFFLHVKGTDLTGEDGDLDGKVRVLESVDEALPELLALQPDVLAITGDHSTPVPMKGHSWHPVPLLLHAPHCFVDDCQVLTELEAIRGSLGTIGSRDLMGLLLGHAGRLAKFGA